MKKLLYLLILWAILLPIKTSAAEKYKLPPQEVIDILDAPPPPRAILNPEGTRLLLADYESMPSIAYMAQPLLRIGGLRILPANNSAQQTTFYTALRVRDLQTQKMIRIKLPQKAKLGLPRWSYDGKWIAFLVYLDSHVELWGLEVGAQQARRLTKMALNTTLDDGFRWMPDNRHILLTAFVENRGTPPPAPKVPVGPVVQESTGKAAKVRTYQDLLKNAYDEALFDYYCTSQLIELNVENGRTKRIGEPAIYDLPQPSPDGRYLLVTKIKQPFSYLVPWYRFSQSIEVWDCDGNLKYQVVDRPLAESIPLHGVVKGPRSVSWRALAPAQLVWVEALDGGDPHREVDYRDALMTLAAPFKKQPQEIVRLTNRYRGIDWLEDGQQAVVYEYDWKRRWIDISLLKKFTTGVQPDTLFSLSRNDRYANPGDPVMRRTTAGEWVIRLDGDNIFLSGDGASPKGDLPFLQAFNMKTRRGKMVFRSSEGSYERFTGFVGNTNRRILTRYESKTEPPNYFIRDLQAGNKQQITAYADPAPQLTGVKKELIKYHRADGVPLSGTLYLPTDYRAGQRLPLVIWAYPREYRNAKIAGQVKGSPNRFTFYRGTSRLFFITQGYAVLDNAQMPVVGDPQNMNDTFVEQIVASARAAIDTLDQMGIIDPRRVGVAGHSYGAFMTANLLAHSDLFAAGIARSGAYNRTLTPFGFQSERRTLWEAPEIYFKVSPFMHADKVHGPILLIHGEADNNSGTFPLQSRRFFAALKGHGATARLVMLPNESHGYRGRESVLTVLAEMFEWFDKYVKNRK